MVSFNFDRKQIGDEAEKEACQFLLSKGLRLLQKNYHCASGEIDLIMQDNKDIVFVEVRKRNRIDYGTALESISPSKIKKIIKTATHFLQKHDWLYKVNSRFDIIAINPILGKMQLEWHKNAFLAEQ